MRNYLAALTLLIALSSSVWALEVIDQGGWAQQPDGTIFDFHRYGDKRFVDGYVVVYGSDGWYYYAELDARGEYQASPYKVGIDDPAEIGIPKNLQRQRSAVRQAERDAGWILDGYIEGAYLTQPDGTVFIAYGENYGYGRVDCTDYRTDYGTYSYLKYSYIDVVLDFTAGGSNRSVGYVISIGFNSPLINYGDYGDGFPFWAFILDSDGWYYYAELDARGEYEASPYRVGIDDPPGYDPPTAVQERSWGAVKDRLKR